MKRNLGFMVRIFLGCMSLFAAGAAQILPVRSVDIYVTPYYSANGGKARLVKVYDKIDALLASGNLDDFKKAVEIVESKPQLVTPMTLFVIAARAYDLGLRDEAVFWFYNAKNRAITARSVLDFEDKMFFETKHAIGAFIRLAGDVINPYAFCDIANQQKQMKRSIQWVKANPYGAIFLPNLPSKHADRKAALDGAIKSLEDHAAQEKAYFDDPKNLAQFKAKRKEHNTDERFCGK